MTDSTDDLEGQLQDAATHVGAEDDLEPVIDNYTLLERIGEGGFGVVYRAEQSKPVRREVALKVIKLGMDTKEVIARFSAERQALAMMEHPNISQVFDAGTTRLGRSYFVMELVRGTPITEYCDEAGLGISSRLDLFLSVCNAVQHAHQKGVIHRDIKPSNVMVTIHDGMAVAKVIDFGIAKATDHRLTERTLYTEQHQMIGTPEYMSPEQAELGGEHVDTRADIYSLGVLLYELLTGTKPHDLQSVLKDGLGAVLDHIREVDPPKPSSRVGTMDSKTRVTAARQRATTPVTLGKIIGGDLDWIVMKALEKDRARRYQSVHGLAMDIWRYRSDEPVSARPPSRSYRLKKYVRRHRVGVAASAAVGLALVVGGVMAFRGYVEAEKQLGRAQRAEQVAQEEARAAQAARKEADMRAAEARKERDAKADALAKLETTSANLKAAHDGRKDALAELEAAKKKTDLALQRTQVMGLVHTSAVAEREDPMRALLLAREAVRRSSSPAVLTQLRSALRNSRERAAFRGHREMVRTVELSPKGDFVLTASDDYIARLWDIKGGEVDFLSHNGAVYSAVFSPDGTRILTAAGTQKNNEGEARIWNLEGERLARLRGHTGYVFSASYSRDGRHILTASLDGTARIWDHEGKEVALLPVHGKRRKDWHAAFSKSGKQVMTVSPADDTLRLWALDGTLLATHALRPPREKKNVLELWLRGEHVLGKTSRNGIQLFDTQGRSRTRIDDTETHLVGAEVSPNGERILTYSVDGLAHLWDLDGRELTEFRGHESGIIRAAFSPRGDRIATGSFDGTARIWDLEGNQLAVLRGHDDAVINVKFLPDSERVFTIGGDRVIRLWDVEGEEVAVHRGTRHMAPSMRWTRTGGRLYLPQPDGSADILDHEGRLLASLRVPGTRIDWAEFSPSGRYTLTGSAHEPGVRLWNVAGKPLAGVGIRNAFQWLGRVIDGGGARREIFATRALFSPREDRFLTFSAVGRGVQIWDMKGEEIFSIRSMNIHDAVFSPSGDRILVSFAFGQMQILSASGKHLQSFGRLPTTNDVYTWIQTSARAQFTRDGETFFATPSGTVGHAYDRAGKKLCSFRWRDRTFEFAAFTPDDKHVFAAMDDHCAYLWDLEGNPPVAFRGHDGNIVHAEFSPDGSSVLTCSRDKTARLWDLKGNLLCAFGGHRLGVTSAMFSDDGRRLFTASADGTVREYVVPTEDLIKLADARITRDFTPEERHRYADLLGDPAK